MSERGDYCILGPARFNLVYYLGCLQSYEVKQHLIAHKGANRLGSEQVRIRALRLRQSWEELLLHEQRKLEAKTETETSYGQLRQSDPCLPEAQKGVVSTLTLARIVAETGPLSDFSSNRKFMRFAGLNLRERQSGKYRGKTKLSKKVGMRLLFGQHTRT